MTKTDQPLIDLDYNGDYVVIQLCDRCITASIQINDLHDLIELNNRLLNVIDRWSEREAEMPATTRHRRGHGDE